MAMMRAVFLLAAIVLPGSGAQHCTGLTIDTNNFSMLQKTGKAHLIKFYSRNEESKAFFPTWKAMTKKMGMSHVLPAARFNVDSHENHALAKELGVLDHGIPSVHLMTPDGALHKVMNSDAVGALKGNAHADMELLAKSMASHARSV